MIHITDKQNCCGCEACVQACPKGCISFDEDTEGFRYPQVDTSSCVECGGCEKVCPIIHQSDPCTPLHFYAAKNKDEAVRLASSSGGIFTLLAEWTIIRGGVVFGARFNERWEVEHSYTETLNGIEAFRTSKYVQSRIGDSFQKACEFLRQGRHVLFSGTSCQIAGLKRFLRKDYDNLLAVDVICHGVPSPKVWRMYLDEIKQDTHKGENTVSSSPIHPTSKRDAQNKDDVLIESISFRDKRSGWKKYSFTLTLAKKSSKGKKNSVSLSHIFWKDPYMKAFLRNISLRPSCYQCPAKAGKSLSDITLADFWGINRNWPDFDEDKDKGVGLAILNSKHGCDIFEEITLDKVEVNEDVALYKNKVFYNSVKRHPKRMLFFKRLNREGISVICLMNSLTQISFWSRTVQRLKNKMRKYL